MFNDTAIECGLESGSSVTVLIDSCTITNNNIGINTSIVLKFIISTGIL